MTVTESPAPAATADTPAVAPVAPGASIDIAHIHTHWKDFVNALRGTGSKGNLDAMLRSACEPVSIDDSILTIGFYHEFHKNYIEDPKYKFLVEKKLREFFGHPYKIRCIVIEASKKTRKSSDTESPVVKAALQRGARLIN